MLALQKIKLSTLSSLDRLKKSAINNKNIITFIIEAIESNATLGEISDTLRKVYGEHV